MSPSISIKDTEQITKEIKEFDKILKGRTMDELKDIINKPTPVKIQRKEFLSC